MGPTACIVLKQTSDALRSEIKKMIMSFSTGSEEDTFLIDGSSIMVTFGEGYPGHFEDYEKSSFGEVVGWQPKEIISFAASGNQPTDHLVLAGICVQVAKQWDGVVDFDGDVLPFHEMPDDVKSQYEEDYNKVPWSKYQPYFESFASKMPGKLYFVSQGPELFDDPPEFIWPDFYGDYEFLQGWIEHPNFRMVK